MQSDDGALRAGRPAPTAAEQAAAGTIVRPIFEPGDALIFDHMNLHRTAIEPGMQHDRYAIETWFLSPSTYGAMTTRIEDGYSPQRPAADSLLSTRPAYSGIRAAHLGRERTREGRGQVRLVALHDDVADDGVTGRQPRADHAIQIDRVERRLRCPCVR